MNRIRIVLAPRSPRNCHSGSAW